MIMTQMVLGGIISNQSLIINDDAQKECVLILLEQLKFNAYKFTNNTGTPTYILGTDAFR